ncbi:hypothetical protein PA598K_04543 [Paenibacillus sp. 598K]|uniref:ABC transporter permease n=1 Tax=Paenibacillus sp. 598K TaxID=1117987 RepID=UPI000FFAF12F|nr:ABC transporter permease [Paenibacillus sp. 598K]GBF76099.1 hypothetical protein PA598K_04543 [Paenibacillus sp. 598K]
MRTILSNLRRREDYLFLVFIGLGILMTLVFASNLNNPATVPVYADESVSEHEQEWWMETLNQGEELRFRLGPEAKARADIHEGRVDVALRLAAGGEYQIEATTEHASLVIVDRYVQERVREQRQLEAAGALTADGDALIQAVQAEMVTPLLVVESLNASGEPRISNTMQVQLLFAFTLFFAIFTIAFKVNLMLEDRNSGVWNRLILSRISKTRLYVGYLVYSVALGILQIVLMLLLMQFGFGIDIGYRYDYLLPVVALYVLTIASFAMLLVGLMRSAETNYAVISMVASSIPMLSGAYFPVSGRVMEAIAEVMPMTHALTALKGIVLYDAGWADLAAPAAKLALMAVLFMGIGINLIERRRPV